MLKSFRIRLEECANVYDEVRYRLVLRMCLLFSALIGLVGILNLSNPRYNGVPDIIVVVICLGCYVLLRKTRNYILVGRIAGLSSLAVINITLFSVDALHYTTPLWMVIHVLFTFIVLQKICGIISLIINFLSLSTYLVLLFPHNVNNRPVMSQTDSWMFIMEFAVIAVALGYMLYVFISAIQLTERHMLKVNDTLNDQNGVITKQKAEMEVMLKEIHHRVKNNLQIISSLLRLQADNVKKEDRSVYYEAVNRVSAMAIIHEKMYQAPTLTEFDLKQYVQSLISSLFESYTVAMNIKTVVNVSIDKMSTKSLVPVAMLLNELVSNSIKHAFANQENPEIKIYIADLAPDQFMIEYNDNGSWIESEADSFGMEIIEAMTQQLDGHNTRVSNADGTYYIFQLKNLP